MDISAKITDLFKTKDVNNTPREVNSDMELKKIENQLNIHLKNKQGLKFKRISLVNDRMYDAEKFTQIIDNELHLKMINKKWNKLPMCIKWQYMKEYMNTNNITDENDITNIRTKLLNNTLEVDYGDNKINKIN
jgi:hypothetical protein